ncbi:MAG: glycosyltransferase family 2 protein [Cytophagaceae bacterium]|nr:glycosyltransferase family 2 protein [Cytophagaceae bacterium]
MISVCIPVYNFEVEKLLQSLQDQNCSVPYELICIDDGSEYKWRELNQKAFAGCRTILLEKNIGRAAIRNLFLQYAKYPYLLFLDCDGLPQDSQFIQRYAQACLSSECPDVVCGGRLYPAQPPSISQRLRWLYGWRRESNNADKRKRKPYQSFLTNNFLVKKSLVETIRFDERLQKYGHEDTLFGIELARIRASVMHIENPVLNLDIETNELFLLKTEEGIQNIKLILNFYPDRASIIAHIRLLRWMESGPGILLKPFFRFCFKLFRKPLKAFLHSGYAPCWILDWYKIGFWCGV